MSEEFIEVKKTLSNRRNKLVYGIGINDVDYKVYYRTLNSRIKCPYYSKWISMLKRCYSSHYHKQQPTYINATVCIEWLSLSNFRKWMKLQDWRGKQLDKDIINYGNKIYSPENCCFVSSQINSLLITCNSVRGNQPLGVYFNNKRKKLNHVLTIANEQTDSRIKNGLKLQVKGILNAE